VQPVSQKESRLRFFWCGRYGSATFNTAGLHRDSDLASRYFIISLTKNHSACQNASAAAYPSGSAAYTASNTRREWQVCMLPALGMGIKNGRGPIYKTGLRLFWLFYAGARHFIMARLSKKY
jgi:hypothetical protein